MFGSKQHSLQVVDLSRRSQTAVQIVSISPASSNGSPIFRFFWQAGRADPLYGCMLPSMEDHLIRKNLCWAGHLLRMPTDRLPRQVLYSQLPDGQRPRGCPRLRYKDIIKRNLKTRDIDTNSWKSLALQRDLWRDTVK